MAVSTGVSGSSEFRFGKKSSPTSQDVRLRLKEESKRIILGEGRQMYLLAAFDTAAPFHRVVGWRDDFHKADYDGYMAYEKKYPEIKKLPTLVARKMAPSMLSKH